MQTLPKITDPENPFEGFFRDRVYLEFKNHLYNYRLRKGAITGELETVKEGRILEIGSGVSPMAEAQPDVIFSDITFDAVHYLIQGHVAKKALVTDITAIPFGNQRFQTIVCSEVLEHIKDDEKALDEITRILNRNGSLILTVPVNPHFFANDDRFVHHFRRYRVPELVESLTLRGFHEIRIKRLAGLLEKTAMILAVFLFKTLNPSNKKKRTEAKKGTAFLKMILPVYKALNWVFGMLVRLEARIIPQCLTTIVLIHAKKENE